ncbi:MAG: ABC transporter permease subunit [Clostridiales bacterium]
MHIFNLAFRRNMGSMVIWTIILGGLLAIAMFLFPTMGPETLTATISGITSSMPQIAVEILGLGSMKILATLVGYFAFAFQFVILLSMIFGAILGARSLTTEEGCGATEYIYAQPITRKTVACQKLSAAILTYFIYSLLISAIALIMAFVFRTAPMMEIVLDMYPALLGLFFCGLIYIAIGFFFSSFLRSNGETIPIMIAVVLITYILGLMGNIVSRVSFLVYTSPIQFANPIMLVQSGINWIQWGIGAVVIILAIIAGLAIYKRKDFRS